MRGISIIEVIIYVAVLVLVMGFTVNAILIMTRSLNTSNVNRNIIFAAETGLERMLREIRLANSIDMAATVFNSHPGQLTLSTTDLVSGASTTIKFYLSASTLMVREGLAAPQLLTSSTTKIANLIFRQVVGSSVSEAVKIELEMQSGEGILQKSEKFYGAAILKASY